MSIFELMILGWVGIIILAVAISPICNLITDSTSADGGHGRRLGEFYDDARKRGLSYSQANDELYLRTVLAWLRRTSSDAVRYSSDRGLWWESLQRSKEEAIAKVRDARPDLCSAFAATVASLSYADILYPDECRVVDDLMRAPALRCVSADERAALTIVRA